MTEPKDRSALEIPAVTTAKIGTGYHKKNGYPVADLKSKVAKTSGIDSALEQMSQSSTTNSSLSSRKPRHSKTRGSQDRKRLRKGCQSESSSISSDVEEVTGELPVPPPPVVASLPQREVKVYERCIGHLGIISAELQVPIRATIIFYIVCVLIPLIVFNTKWVVREERVCTNFIIFDFCSQVPYSALMRFVDSTDAWFSGYILTDNTYLSLLFYTLYSAYYFCLTYFSFLRWFVGCVPAIGYLFYLYRSQNIFWLRSYFISLIPRNQFNLPSGVLTDKGFEESTRRVNLPLSNVMLQSFHPLRSLGFTHMVEVEYSPELLEWCLRKFVPKINSDLPRWIASAVYNQDEFRGMSVDLIDSTVALAYQQICIRQVKLNTATGCVGRVFNELTPAML